MRARRRLDITWLDLLSGFAGCVLPGDYATARNRIETLCARDGRAMVSLSVRSALDLYLRAKAWPAGSEVLCSGYNIPDMTRILEQHQLVPIPVDFALEDGLPDVAAFERACSPRTRAVLAAHLFGARARMERVVCWARGRGLEVWEDCAQAFTGRGAWGHPDSDLALFSFGPIKTATALGGGIAFVRDNCVRAAMRSLEASYAKQSHAQFVARVLKYALLKGISYPIPYALFVRGCRAAGVDYDRVLQSTLRSFGARELFGALRRRPSLALLRLLLRRLRTYRVAAVQGRAAAGALLTSRLPRSLSVAGAMQVQHSYWVYPLLADDPTGLVAALRAAGFDATMRATLAVIPPPAAGGHAAASRLAEDAARVVYLPWDNALGPRVIDRLAELLGAAASKESVAGPRAAAEGGNRLQPSVLRGAVAPGTAKVLLRSR